MKNQLLLASTLMGCILAGALSLNSCEWTDYLGNPQRTGYLECSGPDIPEVLWRVEMPGAFDASPFIFGDTVLVLWHNNMYNTSEAKVLLLNILTGEVLQQFRHRRYLFSEVFFVDDRIIGRDGRRFYEIDLNEKKSVC